MAKNSFESFPKPRPSKGGTNTGDANAVAAEILTTKSAYVLGVKVNGSMPNNGANSFSPSTSSQPIPVGYYNGSGVVNPVTGTSVAADVLAGKTFSSAGGVGQTGTMIDRSGDTAALSSAVSGTTLRLRASDGYRDGTNDFVTITDANFLAANLPLGMTLLGLTGTGGSATRRATGTLITAGIGFDITGLAFNPNYIFYYKYLGAADQAYIMIGVASRNADIYNQGGFANNICFQNNVGGNSVTGGCTFGTGQATGLRCFYAGANIKWIAIE